MYQAPLSAEAPDHYPPPPKWNALVITLIGLICFLFLFFSYFGILKRNSLAPDGPPLFRNWSQRQLLNEANPDNPSLQFHSHGLDSFIWHSLPAIQYQKKSDREIGRGNTDCAVCLGEFKEEEWLRLLPNCGHYFHVCCIDIWFQAHSNCPLCRSHVTYKIMDQHGYSVSSSISLETLGREEAIRERRAGYQVLYEIEVLQTQRLDGNRAMATESTQT